MEEKKGSDLKVFFMVLILVVLAAVVAYIYLYMPLVEKRDALRQENYELEYRLIELKNMAVDEDVFVKNITQSREQIQKVLNNYSAGNTPEKSTMMINQLEQDLGIKFPNLGFGEAEELTTVKMPLISESGNGEYSIAYYDVSLLKENLSTSYNCSYEQLKQMATFISEYPERMNIESITMAYDTESGNLKGNLTLNLYAVIGTGKEYVAPDISGLSLGENNIFQ